MKRPPLFAVRKKQAVPFAFVLDEIAGLAPHTRPMFGCTAVYVEEKIVFVLRDRPTTAHDNGVWIATIKQHHSSLRNDLPSMRSITVLGEGETGWQVLPVEAPEFEESVLHACALVRAGDVRIGKIPKPRKPKAGKAPTRGALDVDARRRRPGPRAR